MRLSNMREHQIAIDKLHCTIFTLILLWCSVPVMQVTLQVRLASHALSANFTTKLLSVRTIPEVPTLFFCLLFVAKRHGGSTAIFLFVSAKFSSMPKHQLTGFAFESVGCIVKEGHVGLESVKGGCLLGTEGTAEGKCFRLSGRLTLADGAFPPQHGILQ